jgi:hypothetical protein
MAPTDYVLDPLTKVLNGNRIEELACSELSSREASRAPLALGLIDVDDFRGVNSRYLLPAGDSVLEQLAPVIANCFAREIRWGESVATGFWSSLPKPTAIRRSQWPNKFAPACSCMILLIKECQFPCA